MGDAPVQVLVVDDQPASRGLAAIWLTDGLRTPVEVIEAATLAQMRARVAERRPDIVILDHRLPDGEGLDGARELLAEDPDTAVILLTGMADPALDEEAERAGVTDFLVKHEIDGPMLARAVRFALRSLEDRRRLRRSEARYRNLVRALPDTAAFVVDSDLRFLMAGGDALESAGWDPETIVGHDAVELFSESGRAYLLEHYRAALAGEARTVEYTATNGRVYRTAFAPLAGDGTGVTEAMAVTLDITEQLRQAAELQRAQAIAITGSWSWDAVSGELRRSPELCRIHGVEPGAPTPTFGAFLRDSVAGEAGRDRIVQAARRAVAELADADFEFEIRRADGAVRVLHTRFHCIADGDGTLLRVEGISQDVTAQRAAEQRRLAIERQLGEAQERLRAAFDAAAAGFVLLTIDGTVVEINDAAARMAGRAVDELRGMDGLSLLHPDDREPARQAMAEALAGGPPEGRFERRLTRADGELVHIVMATSLIRDAAGGPPTFCLQILDISDEVRTRAERDAALRRSEDDRAMLRATLDQLPAHVMLKNLDGRFEFVNAAAAAFLGRPAGELVGLTNHDLFAAEPSDAMRDLERRIVATRDAVSFEERRGEDVFARVKFPVLDGDGAVRRLGAMSWDITEMRIAQETLRAGHEHLERVLANLPGAIVALYDPDLRCRTMEAAFLSAIGIDPASAAGRTLRDLLPHDRLSELVPAMERALAGEEARVDLVSPASGRELETTCAPYRDADGAIVGVVTVTRDISAQRAAERAAQAAELRFELAFDRAPIGMALIALDGHVLRGNAALDEITGRPWQGIAEHEPFAFVHPADAERVRAEFAVAADHDITLDSRILHGDGRTVWVRASVTMVRDTCGEPLHLLVQVQDLSERHRYRTASSTSSIMTR